MAQKETDLRAAARTKCGGVVLDAAFPGCAPSARPDGARRLRDRRTRAAASAARFNAFDGLAIDCDAFDDAAANASCP